MNLLKKNFFILGHFKWLKNWRYRIKYAWQRVTRGWADCDMWELSYFVETITAAMLREMAQNHVGFPDSKFKSDAEYTVKLCDIAEDLENAVKDPDDLNKYNSEIMEYLQTRKFDEVEVPDELNEKWIAESRRIEDWQAECAKRAYRELGELRDYLWD